MTHPIPVKFHKTAIIKESWRMIKRYFCLDACGMNQWDSCDDFDLGKDAANPTILLRKLGIQTALCAQICHNEQAEKILFPLKEVKVITDTMVQTNQWQTSQSFIHLDETKERSLTVSGEAHRHLALKNFPLGYLQHTGALSLGSLFTLHQLEEDGLTANRA